MGRTIHITFTKDNLGHFSDSDMKIMEAVSVKYNTGDLEHIWTCENFYVSIAEGLNENNFESFVKVQGNELNSLLVFEACLEISKQVTDCTLKLYDEGEFLLCPLKMKMGKVLPVLNDMLDDIKRFSCRMLFSSDYQMNILDKLIPGINEFCHEFQMDIGLANRYGDQTSLINDKLRNLKAIEKIVLKEMKAKQAPYFSNIASLDYRLWFRPYAFTRQVDVEKFRDYEGGLKNLLDGFDGEGFGLTDTDAEQKGYEALAALQKLLEKLGFTKDKGFSLEVLKKV